MSLDGGAACPITVRSSGATAAMRLSACSSANRRSTLAASSSQAKTMRAGGVLPSWPTRAGSSAFRAARSG